ncbi:MAG: hypothetical protein ABI591_01835 [Kofleriaceae bacterium]
MNITKAVASEQQRRAVVLYADDGHIIHTHVMYAVNGGVIATNAAAEKRAFEVARELGRPVDHAHALHVDPAALVSGRFVVDVASGTLVAVPSIATH